jgi:hypothetical protein
MSKTLIQWQTPEEAQRSMEFWRHQIHIPGIVACLDGTHITGCILAGMVIIIARASIASMFKVSNSSLKLIHSYS